MASAADLKWALEHLPDAQAPAGSRKPIGWIAATMAASAVALAALAVSWRSQPPAGPPVLRLSISPPAAARFAGDFALSSDGRLLAFTAMSEGRTMLWLRPLDSLDARPLPGTEGASKPFWSPHSASIGFFSGGKLKRVEVAGGSAQEICDATTGAGGTWNAEGVIVFAPAVAGGLRRVSASGGSPAALTGLDQRLQETSHSFPRFLPDGRRFLYWSQTRDRNNAV